MPSILMSEKVNCLKCDKIINKYTNYQYDKPHIFCSQKCNVTYYDRSVENHPLWKGDDVANTTLHQWIYKNYGKSFFCWNPDCNKESIRFDWANINHTKRKNIEEWIMLCRSCHGKFDKWHNKRNRNKKGQFV